MKDLLTFKERGKKPCFSWMEVFFQNGITKVDRDVYYNIADFLILEYGFKKVDTAKIKIIDPTSFSNDQYELGSLPLLTDVAVVKDGILILPKDSQSERRHLGHLVAIETESPDTYIVMNHTREAKVLYNMKDRLGMELNELTSAVGGLLRRNPANQRFYSVNELMDYLASSPDWEVFTAKGGEPLPRKWFNTCREIRTALANGGTVAKNKHGMYFYTYQAGSLTNQACEVLFLNLPVVDGIRHYSKAPYTNQSKIVWNIAEEFNEKNGLGYYSRQMYEAQKFFTLVNTREKLDALILDHIYPYHDNNKPCSYVSYLEQHYNVDEFKKRDEITLLEELMLYLMQKGFILEVDCVSSELLDSTTLNWTFIKVINSNTIEIKFSESQCRNPRQLKWIRTCISVNGRRYESIIGEPDADRDWQFKSSCYAPSLMKSKKSIDMFLKSMKDNEWEHTLVVSKRLMRFVARMLTKYNFNYWEKLPASISWGGSVALYSKNKLSHTVYDFDESLGRNEITAVACNKIKGLLDGNDFRNWSAPYLNNDASRPASQPIKITRLLAAMGITDNEIYKQFSTELKMRKDCDYTISELTDISSVYNLYHGYRGSLGSSCMKECDYFELYDQLAKHGKLTIAVMLDYSEDMIARALIWHEVDGLDQPLMDRIYSVNDVSEEAMKRYAIEKGYARKKYQSAREPAVTLPDGGDLDVCLTVSIPFDLSECRYMPYVDTFHYAHSDKNELSTHISGGGRWYPLNSTDGENPLDNCDYHYCNRCEDRFDLDDTGFTTTDGEHYCCSLCAENDDYRECDCHGDWEPIDNLTYMEDTGNWLCGAGVNSEDARECDRCHNWYENERLSEVFVGNYKEEDWCRECCDIHTAECNECSTFVESLELSCEGNCPSCQYEIDNEKGKGDDNEKGKGGDNEE